VYPNTSTNKIERKEKERRKDTQQSKNKHRETPHKCMIHEDDMHSGGYASEIRKLEFHLVIPAQLLVYRLGLGFVGRYGHSCGAFDGGSHNGRWGVSARIISDHGIKR
jgi:hypothetical protein